MQLGPLLAAAGLVGGISKRVCGLIEQSLKWVHNKDGTKERQKLSCSIGISVVSSVKLNHVPKTRTCRVAPL